MFPRQETHPPSILQMKSEPVSPCDLGPTDRSLKIQVPQKPEQLSDLLKITQPVCSPRAPQHPAHSKDAVLHPCEGRGISFHS